MSRTRRPVFAAVSIAALVLVVAGGITVAVLSHTNGDLVSSSSESTSSVAGASTLSAEGSETSTGSATSSRASSTAATASSEPLKGPQDTAAASPSVSASDGRLVVTPVFTTYGADSTGLFAAAVMPSIVVDDGTCTLTATLGTAAVSASAAPQRGSADSYCSVTIPASSVTAGTWQVQISFSSTQYTGESDMVSVTVQ